MAAARSCSPPAGCASPPCDEASPTPNVPPSHWTREQDKLFELALAAQDLGAQNCWDFIASSVPGQCAASVKAHFDTLLQDIEAIEAGLIALPPYSKIHHPGHQAVGSPVLPPPAENGRSKRESASSSVLSKTADLERRKGIPWTEEEHKSFLLGLAKFGKGDWRSISRNFVRTRTPTQVASHAQKYFIRLNSIKKDRRRTSIHDITSVGGDAAQPLCQGPIIGQGHLSSNPGPPEASAFGEAVGQPIPVSIMGPTVGMPVMIPPANLTGPFVQRGRLPRPIVPSLHVGVGPLPYQMTQQMPPSTS